MALQKFPTVQRKIHVLPPTGPQAVGNRPSATAPPTRPVTRESGDQTNKRVLPRDPYLGRQEFDSTLEDQAS